LVIGQFGNLRQVMTRNSQLPNYRITKLPNPQSGYMLITLMLLMALAAIALLAVLPDTAQQIKRDQEEEMCHRGTQYMRAIQHFYKKFGRYPTRVEELENTNNLRFLRKRYKDPLAHDQQGKERDFKLLHMQDVNLGNGQTLGQMPGSPLSQIPGQSPNSPGALGGAIQSALSSMQPQPGAAGAQNGAQNKDEDDEATPNAQGSTNTAPGGPSGFNAGSTTGTGQNGTQFGGGPILGVASLSKAKTIRVYNKKEHYNDWMFIYDPTSDRGGLLVGPWQIPQSTTLPGATPASQLTPGAQQPQSLGTPFGGQSQSPQPQSPSPQNQDAPNQQ
jgi:type II secretory pathway pseudopilin PulG